MTLPVPNKKIQSKRYAFVTALSQLIGQKMSEGLSFFELRALFKTDAWRIEVNEILKKLDVSDARNVVLLSEIVLSVKDFLFGGDLNFIERNYIIDAKFFHKIVRYMLTPEEYRKRILRLDNEKKIGIARAVLDGSITPRDFSHLFDENLVALRSRYSKEFTSKTCGRYRVRREFAEWLLSLKGANKKGAKMALAASYIVNKDQEILKYVCYSLLSLSN